MPTIDNIRARSAEAQKRKQRFEAWQAPTWADIDFLLSLYDSQATERDWFKRQCENLQDEVRKEARAVNNAATSMRDRCVDAIKSLRATPRGAAYGNAICDAIHKVESLKAVGDKQE